MTITTPSTTGANPTSRPGAASTHEANSTTNRPGAARTAPRSPSALELIRAAEQSNTAPATTPHSAPHSLAAQPMPVGAPDSSTAAMPLSAQPTGFSPEQLAALSAPLDRANVRQREQGRAKVPYLEGWQVIAEANRIFGFDGWQRQTVSVRCVAQAERPIGAKGPQREQKLGWGVTYTARVRITVTAGGLTPLIREGSGAGHGIDVDLGQAHESALKEAETDAMKRALMTFGNPFGLALYDKQQRQVTGSTTVGQAPAPAQAHAGAHGRNGHGGAPTIDRRPALAAAPATQGFSPTAAHGPRAAAPSHQAQALPPAEATAETPLDPALIRSLLERIRGLLPPQLALFSQAFRAAFQVPDAMPSIAGLITEQRHRLWIEHYLSQAQAAEQEQAAR
jgi:hypothetical protein